MPPTRYRERIGTTKGAPLPTATESRTDLDAAFARAVSDYLAFSRSAHLHAAEEAWARKEEELWNEMMSLRARLVEFDIEATAPHNVD